MKTVFSYLPKKLIAGVMALAVVAGVGSGAIAGFGPNRPIKVWSPTTDAFDHVTFNSFTNVGNGIGDERDFFRGNQVGVGTGWTDPVNDLKQDGEVEAKIYIHNGADPALNDAPGNPGIARNTKVRVTLPTGTAQSQQATAFISADNAQPGEIFDTLDMRGANNGFFELSYVAGSGKLHKDGQVSSLSAAQEQQMITTGVNLGDIKGCFEYVQEITFKLKVKMPNYSIAKNVRFEGQGPNDWKENLNVQSGQTVEWKITVMNTGKTVLEDTRVQDQIPVGLTVVPGSVRLIDNANPVPGFQYDASAVQGNGRELDVLMSDYLPGSGGHVMFKTKVDSADKLACGVNKLVNNAYATPKGFGAIRDDASVTVERVCEAPKVSTAECKMVTIEKLGGRKVRVNVATTESGNVQRKNVVYDFGNGTSKTSTNLSEEHEYTVNSATVKVKVNFTVDGQAKDGVTSPACEAKVDFAAPTELPSTGAGSVTAIFAAAAAAGAVAYRVYAVRRMQS
jgi:uncharacterized repeat protein (TIGR01451 family)